ncbi:MAG: DHA2 family efflux MFS transporter permease subunit [Actinomycetota bacterium]|nr:DHA2 family efflux MFS transporter permease subunit [Actinomycetota bacterium]
MSPQVVSPGIANSASSTVAGVRSIPPAVWGIAAVITFGGFMSGLDTSLVNVGLDTIGANLGASLATAQWITSGYLLALAAALPASGWLSGRWGSGRLWLWSLGGFTAASGLCAFAPSIELLVAARVLQGVAGGLLVTAGITILAQAAGKDRMGRILAITGVPTVLAPALGPTVGALLLAHLSWPWLFVINLPIGVVGLLLGRWFVPTGDTTPASPLDWPGLLLVAAGLPLLTYGITEAAQQQNLTDPGAVVSLLGGVLAVAVFVRRSLHQRFPLLDLRVFTSRVYTAAAAQMVFGGAALFGGQIVMPLYFQLQRQASIVDTGLLLLPFGLAAAATFPIGGRLTDRYGGGRVAAAGLALTAAVTIPLALLTPDANLVVVEALQIPRGIGLALAGAPVIAAAMAAVARHQLADASAQISIISRVGGALGSALLVVILTNNLPHGASGAATAGAFHTTFWWLSIASIAALGGAGWLVIEQHRQTSSSHVPLTSTP